MMMTPGQNRIGDRGRGEGRGTAAPGQRTSKLVVVLRGWARLSPARSRLAPRRPTTTIIALRQHVHVRVRTHTRAIRQDPVRAGAPTRPHPPRLPQRGGGGSGGVKVHAGRQQPAAYRLWFVTRRIPPSGVTAGLSSSEDPSLLHRLSLSSRSSSAPLEGYLLPPGERQKRAWCCPDERRGDALRRGSSGEYVGKYSARAVDGVFSKRSCTEGWYGSEVSPRRGGAVLLPDSSSMSSKELLTGSVRTCASSPSFDGVCKQPHQHAAHT